MLVKSINCVVVAIMLGFAILILFGSGFLEFPSVSSPISSFSESKISDKGVPDPFTSLVGAFRKWDYEVGCARFKEKYKGSSTNGSSLQDVDGAIDCGELKMNHVIVLVKGWTWIPDNLDNLYPCRCGLSCLWTKSPVLADKPDALLFETTTPPSLRRKGDPLRVYMDLEAGRRRSGLEDIFIGYHAKDDVQSTYAGTLFHNSRNYHLSSSKRNVST
uniref:Uncharacterized protein n=1 Tax=Nelumbo nucifera TaxID=4432 RepID=A0A822Z2C0_NELNU|nr:TPA_asm: hypothetical protein HUJ06_013495 [Nelumbo nucifera]